MKTVAELYQDIRKQAGSSGVCDTGALMRRMNIVGPELLDEIDAKGTLWTWCLPVCGNCVILPMDIYQVKQAAVCGRAVTQRSEFWIGRMMGDEWADGFDQIPWSNFIELNRTSCTYYPVEPVQLNEVFAIQAKSQADVGKEVELRWFSGPSRKAVTVTVKIQGGQQMVVVSPDAPGELVRFSKPRTKGNVVLWVMNQSTGNSRMVSSYDPREELPEYRVFQLSGFQRCCAEMQIRGKRKWLELRDDADIVPFGRVMAWRNALMAEAASEEGKIQERNQYMAAAIADLEREKRGWESPNNQKGIQIISPWSVGAGSASLGRRGFTGPYVGGRLV